MTIAIICIAGIGLISAIVLAVADKYLSVREDPRIGMVTAELPGANCGGCGFAGCDGYARALVAGTAPNGACAAGGEAVAKAVAKILGVEAAATERRVAIVKCCGTRSEALRVGDYNGICDCNVAAATAGGDKGCTYGCLGYGACANVCPKHAISIHDGLAKVDKRLCIGCGKCATACPKKLIELVPASATIHVLCNNPEKGPNVRKVCGVGCMGCHLCEKNSGGKEANHFTFNGFLAKVNYANPPTDAQIVAKCPAKCMAEDPPLRNGCMMPLFALLGAAVYAGAAFGGLVAHPQAFDAARLARSNVMGRGYWTQSVDYNTTDRAYPGNRNTGIGELPVFRDRAIGSWFGNRRPVKGSGLATWRTVAENMPGGTNSAAWQAFEKTGTLPVPTFAGFWAKRDYQSMCGKIDLDYADFAAWTNRHPNLVCIELLDEWVGDLNNIKRRLKSFANDAEREEVKRRYYSFGKTREGLLKSAKAFVDRKLAVNYGATRLFGALSSNIMSADFMAAAWGAKCIAEEVTDTNMQGDWEMRWELPAFSCRGAARQFGIPWKWYVAIFKSGYTHDGTWQVETTCVQDPGGRDPDGKGLFGPKGGLSPSLERRGFYYGYLAGANFLQTEMSRMQLFAVDREKKAEVLSDRGKAWVEVDRFARNNPDRGEPYAPVAILMPFDQGYGSHGGQGWYHQVPTYTAGDHMLDGVFYTIIPGRKRAEEMKRGVEHCLHNGDMPMMFDALCPDAPQDRARFLSVLKAYPAAILAGSYTGPGVAGFWPTLMRYVRAGGTLLVPQANVPESERAKLRGARYACRDDKGDILGTVYDIERGRLIVSASAWMVPEVGPDIWKTQLDMWSGKRSFPEIAFFLKKFRDELYPFAVRGSCLHGANKTAKGWWLWAMNNDGVTKFTDTLEKIDPRAAHEITVDLKGLAVRTVRELLTGRTIAVRDGSFTWTIPAGDVAVFEIVPTSLTSEWMTYPGDFEISLSERFQSERLEWGGHKPPFWPVPRHDSVIRFRKAFDLAAPERIEVYADGEGCWRGVNERFGGFADGRATLDLPAGKTELYFEVANRDRVPALYVAGRTIRSDGSWLCSVGDENWVNVATNGFTDSATPPGAFRLKTERRKASCVRKTAKGGLLADFGCETFGRAILRGVRGSGRAKIVYGESEKEALADGLSDPILGEKPNAADVWRFVNLSETSEQVLSDSCGFRYVNVVPLDAGLSVDSIEMEYEYLPLEDRGSFRCSDELVNRIWQTSAYTLQLTMREFFLDGIKRDRWIWSGDAYQSFLMNYYSFADAPIVRRTLTALGGKGPVLTHINTIVDYTFYWMMGVRDYYLYSGDVAFLKQIWPRVCAHADWTLSRCRKDGMYAWHEGDWVFVDWAPEPLDNKRGPVAFEQMLLSEALEAASACAEIVGDNVRKTDYAAKARALRQQIVPTFWDEKRGGLVHALDPQNRPGEQLTRYANMFGLMNGYFDAEKRNRVVKDVLLNPEVMAIQTPYMRFYELEAFCAVGRHAYVLDEIRSYWGAMLKEGATTFWELYNPKEKGDEHLAMYGRDFGRSKCHAWGATPLYLLGRYFLGVRPTKPGYAQYEVRPVLGGLAWMEGTVSTPSGDISVSVCDGVITVRGNGGKGSLVHSGKTHAIPPNASVSVEL